MHAVCVLFIVVLYSLSFLQRGSAKAFFKEDRAAPSSLGARRYAWRQYWALNWSSTRWAGLGG